MTQTRKRRRNYSSSEELFEKFHGRKPDKVSTIMLPDADYPNHPELAQLGKLETLTVGQGLKFVNVGTDDAVKYETEDLFEDEPGWELTLTWGNQERPDVAGETGGHQIYLIGGRQYLPDEMLKRFPIDPTKDLIDLGPCMLISYITDKPKFKAYEPQPYIHSFGEDSGKFAGDNGKTPRLLYHRIRRKLYVIGGVYTIEPEGIAD